MHIPIRIVRLGSRRGLLLVTSAVLLGVLCLQITAQATWEDCQACGTTCQSPYPDCTWTSGNFWWCCSTHATCSGNTDDCCQLKCKEYDFTCTEGNYKCILKMPWQFYYFAGCGTINPGECLSN